MICCERTMRGIEVVNVKMKEWGIYGMRSEGLATKVLSIFSFAVRRCGEYIRSWSAGRRSEVVVNHPCCSVNNEVDLVFLDRKGRDNHKDVTVNTALTTSGTAIEEDIVRFRPCYQTVSPWCPNLSMCRRTQFKNSFNDALTARKRLFTGFVLNEFDLKN